MVVIGILCTSVNSTGQPTRVSRQVELEIEVEEMLECLPCYLAHCALAHARKRCVE